MIQPASPVFRQGQSVVQGNNQTMPDDFLTRLRARCRARGFTLVELMITVVVAGILAMLAVPSFHRLIISNRLTTAASGMSNAINLARLDAIKLNSTTQFCGNSAASNTGDTLGSACGTQAGAVYALPQSAASASEVRTIVPGITDLIRFSSAGVTGVRFSGQGFGYAPGGSSNSPYTGTVAVICTSDLAYDNRRVISMTAGSIVATATSTGSCP